MDTKKAFDSISHEYIAEVLEKFGFPPWFLTLFANLLRDVQVNPRLGGQSNVWISIQRGVKQGCPLSPIIFAIVMDPLLVAIRMYTKCDAFSFADDMAIDTFRLPRLNLCMRIIDQFGEVSDAMQNHDKTAIIASRKARAHKNKTMDWIENCPWPKLNYKRSHIYLGVLYGHSVTVKDIFEKAITKAVTRAARFKTVVKWMSHQKRVVTYNVFILPILSYLYNLFNFPYDIGEPDSALARIRKAASNLIISFTHGYSYQHLLGGSDRISSLPPLRDVTAASMATKAAQADVSQWHGYQRGELVELFNSSSVNDMRISQHIHIAGLELAVYHMSADPWGSNAAFDASDYNQKSLTARRQSMYHCLVRNIYKWDDQDPDVEAKAASRGLTPRAKNRDDDTKTADLINSNYATLPSNLPYHPSETRQLLILLQQSQHSPKDASFHGWRSKLLHLRPRHL
jgi:hypothetical protein